MFWRIFLIFLPQVGWQEEKFWRHKGLNSLRFIAFSLSLGFTIFNHLSVMKCRQQKENLFSHTPIPSPPPIWLSCRCWLTLPGTCLTGSQCLTFQANKSAGGDNWTLKVPFSSALAKPSSWLHPPWLLCARGVEALVLDKGWRLVSAISDPVPCCCLTFVTSWWLSLHMVPLVRVHAQTLVCSNALRERGHTAFN